MTNSGNISNYVKNYQYLYRTESKRFLSGEKYKNKRTILILFHDFKNLESSNLLDDHFIFMDKDNKLVIKNIESHEEMDSITSDAFD